MGATLQGKIAAPLSALDNALSEETTEREQEYENIPMGSSTVEHVVSLPDGDRVVLTDFVNCSARGSKSYRRRQVGYTEVPGTEEREPPFYVRERCVDLDRGKPLPFTAAYGPEDIQEFRCFRGFKDGDGERVEGQEADYLTGEMIRYRDGEATTSSPVETRFGREVAADAAEELFTNVVNRLEDASAVQVTSRLLDQ